jgi:excinuclease ABC subunit C
MVKSVLDDVPGLGEVRRKRLIKEFGSVKAVKAATLDELSAVSWLPESVAATHGPVLAVRCET